MRIALLIAALFVLVFPVRAWAFCEEPTTVSQLEEAAKKGEEAFANMDKETLLEQTTLAREEVLPCLGESLSPEAIAGFHRLMALEAFTRGNDERVISELHAARRLEPGYDLHVMVPNPGHKIHGLNTAASMVADGDAQTVYPPKGGYVLVAGVRNAPRYSKTPTIIQAYGPGDVLIETRYIQPGEALPQYQSREDWLSEQGVGGVDLTQPRGWYWSAAAVGVLAGSSYFYAQSQKAKYLDTSQPDTPETLAALPGYASRSKGFGVTSVALGSGAVALAGTGLVMQVRFGGSRQRDTLEVEVADGR